MGLPLSLAFDSWLRDGGTIITANDRAARTLRHAYNLQRTAEGMQAWPSPAILDWATLLIQTWSQIAPDDRLVLNRAQEESLWAEIIASQSSFARSLPEMRYRMAQQAMQGYALLCGYAPLQLDSAARKAWTLDKAIFSDWLSAFESTCRSQKLISPSRLAFELIPLLQSSSAPRSPLLTLGFDRLQPTQESFLLAWGHWQRAETQLGGYKLEHWKASDPLQELEGCAAWCSHFLREDPSRRILVLSNEMDQRRGEIERAFLEQMPDAASSPYEFSLGIPLDEAPGPKAHLLLLRWLTDLLQESAIDWLLTSGISAQDPAEALALQASMRSLRDAGLQRPLWSLSAFTKVAASKTPLPPSWVQRLTSAQKRLLKLTTSSRQPAEWSDATVKLISDIRPWGNRDLSSAEYQSMRKWETVLDTCSSLGFSGQSIDWPEFIFSLSRAMKQTLFSPESEDAPILITGPAESAGLQADAIWFLGTDEDTWPSAGNPHPLLPIEVQRAAGMPHADPAQEWVLAEAITTRLLASASIVHFSYARRKESTEQRPSSIVARLAPAQAMHRLRAPGWLQPQTGTFTDTAQVPFTARDSAGGSGILTAQSQCPFKAFAHFRLGAQNWDPGRPCLTPAQRGQLLHAVLHSIWGGPPNGLSTLEELKQKLPHLESFVTSHVESRVPSALKSDVRAWMPARYLELERLRLVHLLTEWLRYEATRLPFTVTGVEASKGVSVAGLSLHLRMDRVDRLNDGSALIIDYKTGDVSTKEWDMPRPGDVQLPLYATFALGDPEPVGGLTFAKVRAGQSTFAGFFSDASKTLFPGLKGANSLVKNPLTPTMLEVWKLSIEQFAADFLHGKADVDPREGNDTCKTCRLHTLCRIHERSDFIEHEDEAGEDTPDA